MHTPSPERLYGPHGRTTPCTHLGPCNDWTHPRTLDEIIAERDTPPLTIDEMVKKWAGVFEPEFWEAVRSARDAR
jgi:hypothetical protein